MELNDEKEPCIVHIPEKVPDQKVDFNDVESVTVKKNEKKDIFVGDDEDDLDIDEVNQIMPANRSLMAEITLCDKGEDEWLIDEDSDSSIEFDFYVPLSKEYKKNTNTNSKSMEFVTRKLNNSTIGSKMKEPISNVKKSKKESVLSSVKTIKNVQHLANSTLNKLNRPPRSDVPNPSCSTSVPSPSGSSNIPGPSSPINLPDPLNSASIPGPSCSTSLPGPSYVFPSHKLSSLFDSANTNLSKERQARLLTNFYHKIFLDDNDEQNNSELDQNIKISKLKDCDYIKQYLSKYTDEEPETENTERSECFVEDPDIVNPDIMYNIDLNEYYNELDLLALKVLKTPDDPTGLVEYKQLPPIPQIEQTNRKFTADERFRFANGISEWEYQIDRDDWNKIMVKRSVVFTAHAGFSIANEESLYVLADVAIDYVKKLAVTMKKHFDIQADNPYPDSIDPINNSLQEVSIIFFYLL